MVKLKPPTTYNQQVQKLRSRGCKIGDEPFCVKVLSQVNYYRFSGYFLPFRKPDGNYLPGTDFNTIYQIYEFDRHLRSLLFAVIEEIEISLRAKFAYYHALNYGPNGYMNPANYNYRHDHSTFKEKIETEIEKNKKSLFVGHHLKNYDGQFPIWVITELFTFGMLSYFYSDLPTPDQKQLARYLYNTTNMNLISWLRCCTDIRNICAHYGRLYFRIFPAIPANLSGLEKNIERRLFGVILVLKTLYPDTDKWNIETYEELKKLIASYSNVINLNHIGFPTDWESRLKK